MTNITEAKRIRDQLTASHERFTTVLEGLDTAVSVLSVQSGELLFANRSYRLWFGADARGHAQLSGGDASLPMPLDGDDAVDALGGLPTQELTAAGSDSREIFVESLGQVVRGARPLPAVDRRPAGADADRHRHLRAAQRRGRCRAPGREGAGDEPAGDDGRDGLVGGARAEPAAHRHHQLLQRHGDAGREQRHRQVRPDRGAAEDLAPGRAGRADHPSHPRLREAQRAAAAEGARRRRSSTTRSTWPASSCGGATSRSRPTWRSACRR